MLLNVVLWAGGLALVALATWRGRAPYARMSELDRLAENARRYDSWRERRSAPSSEVTGADIMRQLLRRQVGVWVGVGILGVLLILAGFAIR